MRIYNQKIFILFIGVLFLENARGEILLPSLFSDGVVLQQNTEVKIWGWAPPGDTLKIVTTWNNDTTLSKVSEMSYWEATIKTRRGGFDTHKIEVFSKNDLKTVNDVLLGEVWLSSGQSNMEWGAQNGHQEIMEEMPYSYNQNIRLFHVPKIASFSEQEDIKSKWQICGPVALANFSSIGYFAGKKLHEELNVPIGIINASWGGTSAEMWLPDSLVRNDLLLKSFAEPIPYSEYHPNQIGSCWNSMIYPLTQFRIAGVLWYQGESNVWSWKGYDKLFIKLISSWREAWKVDFPFYYVQIAPFQYNTGENAMAAHLRSKQTEVLSLANTGMVVTTDLVDNIKDIHPGRKKEVAHRLANIALAEVYGKELIDYKSPVFSHYTLSKNRVKIYFKYLEGNLAVKEESAIKELYIAGEDQIYHKANFEIAENALEVFYDNVQQPKYVKFGFSDIAQPNLFNTKGLPVSPFFVKL